MTKREHLNFNHMELDTNLFITKRSKYIVFSFLCEYFEFFLCVIMKTDNNNTNFSFIAGFAGKIMLSHSMDYLSSNFLHWKGDLSELQSNSLKNGMYGN